MMQQNVIHFKCKLIYQLPLIAMMGILAGCSSLGISDGSLDYQKASLQKPLILEAGQENAIRQIFPLPERIGQTVAQQKQFSNRKNNRYVLPKPSTDVTIATTVNNDIASIRTASTANSVTPVNASETANNSLSYNKALTENEKGVPILQVQASSVQTKQKLLSILKRANYTVKDVAGASHIIIASNAFSGNRILQLSNLGTVTTVMVTNPDATLAQTNEARFILNTINKRW